MWQFSRRQESGGRWRCAAAPRSAGRRFRLLSVSRLERDKMCLRFSFVKCCFIESAGKKHPEREKTLVREFKSRRKLVNLNMDTVISAEEDMFSALFVSQAALRKSYQPNSREIWWKGVTWNKESRHFSPFVEICTNNNNNVLILKIQWMAIKIKT